MYRMLIVIPFTALLLSACVVTPAHRVVVAPALPVIVEFDREPYYYQHGYYYHYHSNHWRYSQSRSGPWVELPRSHYPKEIKYKGRGDGRGWDRDKDKDRGRDKDRDRDHDRDHDRRY